MHDLGAHIIEHWSHERGNILHVACSGGVDSMALLHCLHEAHFDVRVIHVNYQLRGEDSNQDEAFVHAFCQQQNIPFSSRRVALNDQLKTGGNLQELARNVRYNWFEEILAENDQHRIVLAHHANDQVETFFMNLARKSGIMGLSCMPEVRNKILRPFLNFSKSELKSYAISNEIPWREDQSNQKNNYRRNILRNVFIPEIKQTIPTIETSVLTLIETFQQTQRNLETSINSITKKIQKEGHLNIEEYNHLNEWEKIELLRQMGVPASYVQRFNDLTQSSTGKEVPLPSSNFKRVVRNREQLDFLELESFQFELKTDIISSLPEHFSKDVIFLDADKVSGPLQLRVWETGDRIASIGLNGSQLISKIIKDARFSPNQKSKTLVLHDDRHIHWCVGLKVGRHALATEKTREILRCSVIYPITPK